MKQTFRFLFTMMLLFAWCASVAQEYPASNGPIPLNVKGHSTVVTNDPTPTDATVGFAFSNSNNQFRSLPLPGGTPLTTIGPHTYTDFAGGGCFGGDGQFYVSTVGNTSGTPQIWTQNLTTGAATLVGSTGLPAAEGFNGLAYDHTTSTYYGSSGTNLYTFNNTTGQATLVGPFNNAGGLSIDIAVDCNGSMYMHDLGLDNIYSVNKATGNATLIGSTGFNANFGQGMGYDHDAGILYLFAFDATTFTAQLRTVNVATGMTTVVFDYGLDQHAPFDGQAGCGAPCPVGGPTNPTPSNGATGLPITGNSISWTNGAGTTHNEIYFNGNLEYDDVAVTSRTLAQLGVEPLQYSTTYNWRVVCKDAVCGTSGSTWTFTTMADPLLIIDTKYCTDFTAGIGDWTITNEGGTCVWSQLTTTSNTYTLPATAAGNILGADSDLCGSGTTLLSTATLNNVLDFTTQNYHYMELVFDNDWRIIDAADEAHVEISTDGGSTWASAWSRIGVDQRNTTEVVDITSLVTGQSNVRIRFRTVQPGWDWWWAVDNVCIYAHYVVPVELTSFAAAVVGSNVELNWSTATETNNQGFQVERSNGVEFTSVGYVAGHGTTTETQNYRYVDRNVQTGSYSYRLKQVDYDGTFEYSDVVEVEIGAPVEFALDQNYPNPFNPSTKITFRLAAESKVSLKVFDVLGQEVMTLINNELSAGSHQVEFDASGLNSGVYFYKIEATGSNGMNFNDVKKMILTK